MRPPPPDAGTATVVVRRLSDGAECVIDQSEMDTTRYALVRAVVPSAGTDTLEAELDRRVRRKATP